MALTIGTNVASLQASAAASSVNRDLETSMARLSTGKRINSAADDAAGVAIASRLTTEIRGTDQAIRNALDGQAMIDTVEGGHKEIEAILQRMREISVQASNDTNSADDRSNLQTEMDAMIKEIDRIASTTTWAGQNLMQASTTISLQVGSATGTKNQIAITIGSMTASTLALGDGTKSTILLIADAGTGFDANKHDDSLDADGAGGTAFDQDTAIQNALASITKIDAAIKKVNTQRSDLGAISNRLSHTVSNMTNISTNLSAARGSIEDADFALETTQLAKNQILQQAGTAMLAQANASKQNVLSLLQ